MAVVATIVSVVVILLSLCLVVVEQGSLLLPRQLPVLLVCDAVDDLPGPRLLLHQFGKFDDRLSAVLSPLLKIIPIASGGGRPVFAVVVPLLSILRSQSYVDEVVLV